MKAKAYTLISIAVVWMSALCWSLWKARLFVGTDFTVAVTKSTVFSWLIAALLALITFLIIVVLLLGWIIPLSLGVRILNHRSVISN
jgi:hypothetical protein